MSEQLDNGDRAINEVLQKIKEGEYSAPYERGMVSLTKTDIPQGESTVFARKVGSRGSSLGAFASVRLVDGRPEFTGSVSDTTAVKPSQSEEDSPQEIGFSTEATGSKVDGVEDPTGAQQLKEKAAQRIEEVVQCLALTGAKVTVDS